MNNERGQRGVTKSESKYFNTARMMDEALIELLCKKDIQYISVKEICAKAGVNRSTFYLHYETISDLLEETIEHIQAEFQKSFHIEAGDFIEEIDNMLLNGLIRRLIKNDFVFQCNRKRRIYLRTDCRENKRNMHVYRRLHP